MKFFLQFEGEGKLVTVTHGFSKIVLKFSEIVLGTLSEEGTLRKRSGKLTMQLK